MTKETIMIVHAVILIISFITLIRTFLEYRRTRKEVLEYEAKYPHLVDECNAYVDGLSWRELIADD